MDEALKKISAELEAELKAWFDTAEVKEVVEATKAAGDTGTFEIVITTENLDRYQEVIKLDAWELEHYNKNPVVLWGHDHRTLPIGVTTSLENKDGKLVARGKFAPHEYAQTIRKLYDMGVLRAASVGFIEKEREGNLITKAELIEWSIVSVPANPYCLSTLVKSGVNVNEIVTKGFVFLEMSAKDNCPECRTLPEGKVVRGHDHRQKDGEEEKPETAENEPETEQLAEHDDEKAFQKTVIEKLEKLEASIVALEAVVPDQEPERNDAPEEEKALKEFSAKRKILQDASTVLAEVLAEARQAIEAQKA